MSDTLEQIFGHKVRPRVCGLCVIDNKLLLIKQNRADNDKHFWSPPGGGIDFLESLENALKREFKEECGIDVAVLNFLVINEFIHKPFHAIELFYHVKNTNNNLPQLGLDPELPSNLNIIHDLRLFTLEEILQLKPEEKHGFLHKIDNFEKIF